MADKPSNCICKEHSGIMSEIQNIKDDISENVKPDIVTLWGKWDGMNKLVIVALVTLAMNLIGVVALLARTLF